ncbi:LysR family transcriptional regulator [Brevundimonas sanguinis]|uniref:LysR family transcriptional regulator n=1 Tax=Brevundimonas sanguinis TaxID=3021811 RepID=UPI00241584AF|nr:LysR family transcriptional regulator [Brevundimonas sp. NCCP 15609]
MKLKRSLIPDLTVLQAFECAARHGNFTKAGAELNLTQSAVSRQVKMLEEQFGVLLFERVRQRVVLSAAGRRLLPEAARLLQQSEEMVLLARAASGGEVLSIATLPTFGTRWLLPRLPDFMARHPGLTVNVASRAQPFDLEAENVDLAIHYGQPVWANAICTYLRGEAVLPVASPALLKASPMAGPQDLAQARLLHLATRPRLWAEWFRLNDLDDQAAYRGDRFDQFSMIIAAAVHGLGVALLPLYLIEEEIAAGALRTAFDRPMATDKSYFAVLPEGRRESGPALAFQTWLLSQV